MTCATTLVSVAALCGCASKSERGMALRRVDVTEFGTRPSPTQPVAAAESESKRAAGPEQLEPIEKESPIIAEEAPAKAEGPLARAGPRPGEQLMKPGDIIVIDSVVGQVSGRPIFADALLEPMAEELRAQAAQLDAREFANYAQARVFAQLREVVLSELFIAEAEASLTPEQQQGLFAMLRDLQERQISTGKGSRTITEERLLEELGLTIEEYTERERNTRLIWYLLNKKVEPRAIVSWKDVQREYERRKSEFNPAAGVTLKMLRLSTQNDADRIDEVNSRLAAGESFDAIAESIGSSAVVSPDPFPMGPGGITDIPINEAFKPALAGLDVGQTSQPIEADGRVTWLHVVAIQQQPGKTLLDVQRQLYSELKVRRQTEEREEYIRTLLSRGIHDELDEMARRVLTVALLRYAR
jgi:hypothetical protein